MFLRHSVDCEIHRTVQQGQQLIDDKYNEKDRIQNTQHAAQLTTSNREHGREEDGG